jgi:uncharacterized protein (DUF885 family)
MKSPAVLASLVSLAVLVSCASTSNTAGTAAPSAAPAAAGKDDAAIEAAEKAYIDLTVAISPESATGLGLHERDTELDDYTLAGNAASRHREKEMLVSLRERFAKPEASRAKRVDLELVEHALDVSIREDEEQRPLERLPMTYVRPLDTLFNMVARPYAPPPERAANVLARMEKLPAVLAAGKANLKNPPRLWTQVAIESTKQVPAFLAEIRPFLEKELPKDGPRVKAALDAVAAAYASFAEYLEKDVLPRSNGEFAVGRAYFDYLLHENYFLTEDADQVEALGKKLLDRTDAEMTALAKKIDPKASGWPEVLGRIKKDHARAEDLLPWYRRELGRARAFLVQKDVVPMPPNDDCEVLETPAFLRNTTTAAYNEAPAFDTATTRGFFFVTPVDASLDAKQKEELLMENNRAEGVDTVVHETYPGHHLQLSFSRRHPSLARKALGTSLFSEGWGLYSEELMDELGYYTDAERMAYLEWVLVRAARVIIDVGLQTKGMTFEQAVGMLEERVHLEKVLAVNEVKRYTMSPTQPLSYLVGREMIVALREKMKQRDGAGFSLKRFHEEVLSHGTIPPGLMAEEIFGG